MSPTLGQRLKSTREQKGLRLADVSHKTRISVPRLMDMEEDNYTAFGSLTYARSFLQTYADLLGVDAHPVTERMNPTPLSGASNYRYLVESYGAWVGDKPDRSLMHRARPMRSAANTPGLVAAIAGLLLFVGGVLWAATIWADRKFAPNATTPVSAQHDEAADTEEIRPAVPHNANPAGNVPIRKALAVDDEPRAKSRR